MSETRNNKCIGIVGSRRRNSQEDFEFLRRYIKSIVKDGDTFVSGGCPKGGDRFAEIIAKELGISIRIHYPDWSKGRYAGLERNTLIARDADVLIALIAPDRRGGTEDTIRKFKAMGKTELQLL
ncbi:MAG: hypothetical protein DRP09_10390 [Candidatus Thorarchaeota archaeon]|nr:MAG: hypothetical protein DRP09_10390 [Candidatus Thorarchaeota archaeon]